MPNTGPKTTLKSNPKTHQKTGDSTESITAEGILDRAFMQLWHRRWTQVQSVNFSATAFELIFPVCPGVNFYLSAYLYSYLSAPA